MKITTIVVGCMEANCYLLERNETVLLIDPGDEYLKIKKHLGKKSLLGILITHSHPDHVGALKELLQDYAVPVYQKKKRKEQTYQVGEFSFSCIATPGHTSDSVSFYFEEEKILFTGDFVFRGTIGRSDFPTGNMVEMDESIEKIKQLPKDVLIYSGHGDVTTLERELATNPYFS